MIFITKLFIWKYPWVQIYLIPRIVYFCYWIFSKRGSTTNKNEFSLRIDHFEYILFHPINNGKCTTSPILKACSSFSTDIGWNFFLALRSSAKPYTDINWGNDITYSSSISIGFADEVPHSKLWCIEHSLNSLKHHQNIKTRYKEFWKENNLGFSLRKAVKTYRVPYNTELNFFLQGNVIIFIQNAPGFAQRTLMNFVSWITFVL